MTDVLQKTPTNGKYILSDAQEIALAKLRTMRSSVIALQTGLGKTILSLHFATELLEKDKGSKILFFIPKSARAAYEKELTTKLCVPYLLVNTEHKDIKWVDLENNNIILCEHAYLSKVVDALVKLSNEFSCYMFVDEAHCLQTETSVISKALASVRVAVKGVYLLTASPLMNDIEGLFNLYHFAFPKVFTSWFAFRKRYCITRDKEIRMKGMLGFKKRVIKEIIGYQNMEELNGYLDRLTIKGCLKYNVSYDFLKCPIDEERKPYYKKAAKGVIDITDAQDKKDKKVFGARLHDLQRVVDGYSYGDLQEGNCNKVRLLMSTIKSIMDREESTLVYLEYTEGVDFLQKILKDNAEALGIKKLHLLTGEQKEEVRSNIEKTLGAREVVLMTSAGKQCFGRGTKILMSDGRPKSVEDIQVGDEVMGMDSKPRRVVELHSGIDQLFRVKQRFVKDYVVNSHHIMSVQSMGSTKATYGTNLKDLPLEYFRTYKVPLTAKKVKWELPEIPVPVTPYLVGLWFGCGVLGKAKFRMSKKTIGYVSEIITKYVEENNLNVNHIWEHSNDCIELIGSSPLHDVIELVGSERRIPDNYLYNSLENRKLFFEGFVDGAQPVFSAEGVLDIKNTDPTFLRQMCYLCDSLGLLTWFHKFEIMNKTVFMLRVSGYLNNFIFEVTSQQQENQRNPHKTREEHKGFDFGIHRVKVKKDNVGEYYGFEVSGDPHFLLDNGVVVHNSRNLQRANNIIFFNIPYSTGAILQITGRICRMDSTYDHQNMYILEVENSIDTYKVKLFKDHLSLINNLFGEKCTGTMTCDYVELDRTRMDVLRDKHLWNMK